MVEQGEFPSKCGNLLRGSWNCFISMKNYALHEGSEVLFWYVSGFLGRLMIDFGYGQRRSHGYLG
jgi:hypothetical protein